MAWLLQGQPEFAVQVEIGHDIPLKTRLDIYANAYRLRLLEALQENYPALHTLLGDERFEQLSTDYIHTNPSQHFSLRYFGDQLPSFIGEQKHLSQYGLLAEMATFEWALRTAFDAADDIPLEAESLMAIAPQDWPALDFSFHSSLHRLDLRWNAPNLWQAIDADAEPIPPQRQESPVPWLIWRHDLTTHYRSLEVDEAWAIDQALSGAAFGSICEGLCEWIDPQHTPLRAATMVARWLNEGCVVAIE